MLYTFNLYDDYANLSQLQPYTSCLKKSHFQQMLGSKCPMGLVSDNNNFAVKSIDVSIKIVNIK